MNLNKTIETRCEMNSATIYDMVQSKSRLGHISPAANKRMSEISAEFVKIYAVL